MLHLVHRRIADAYRAVALKALEVGRDPFGEIVAGHDAIARLERVVIAGDGEDIGDILLHRAGGADAFSALTTK